MQMDNRLGHSVVLYTGMTKHLHDLEVGDFVMSESYQPNRVIEINTKPEEIYRITGKRQQRKPFYLAKNNKIRLKKYDVKQDRFSTVELSIDIFKYMSERDRNKYYLYPKKGWDLPGSTLRIPPYELGRKILSDPLSTIDFLSQDQKLYLKKFYHSAGYSIPNDYLYGKTDVKKLFLAGILDSYGYIDNRGKLFHVFQNGNTHLQSIEVLCLSLGFETQLKRNSLIIKGNFGNLQLLKHDLKAEMKVEEQYQQFTVASIGVKKYKQVFFQHKGHHLLSNGIVMYSSVKSGIRV